MSNKFRFNWGLPLLAAVNSLAAITLGNQHFSKPVRFSGAVVLLLGCFAAIYMTFATVKKD